MRRRRISTGSCDADGDVFKLAHCVARMSGGRYTTRVDDVSVEVTCVPTDYPWQEHNYRIVLFVPGIGHLSLNVFPEDATLSEVVSETVKNPPTS